jgi:predicted amidohydrolase YtcJ
MEAIVAGTRENARFFGISERLGTIEAGKLADLVVLGRDPFKVDPMDLIDIPVERTMVGGKWVWES